MHVVRSGDTIKSVAEEYNTTEENIRNGNRQYFPTGERGIMFPGQMLHIRIINNTVSNPNHHHHDDPFAQIHIVAKSDTFESICDMYNLTRAHLLQKNKVTFPMGMKPRLLEGQALVVGRCHANMKMKEKCGSHTDSFLAAEVQSTKKNIHVDFAGGKEDDETRRTTLEEEEEDASFFERGQIVGGMMPFVLGDDRQEWKKNNIHHLRQTKETYVSFKQLVPRNTIMDVWKRRWHSYIMR
jgi:LysM repeat protein